MFLIDGSGSVQSYGFQQTLTFLKDFVQMFDVGPNKTQFALIVFGNIVDKRFDFDTYSSVTALENAIDSTP